MNTFPIRGVERSRAQSVEPLGSKPKFRFREGDRRLLFKGEDRGTGDGWGSGMGLKCPSERVLALRASSRYHEYVG